MEVSGPRDRAFLEFLRDTGLRLSEVLRVTLDDFDEGFTYLRVRQGKGRKDRIAPLEDASARRIRQYIPHVRPRNAFRPELFLTLTHRGGEDYRPIDPQSIKVMNARITRRLRAQIIASVIAGAHRWRHTFGIRAADAGATATERTDDGADGAQVDSLAAERLREGVATHPASVASREQVNPGWTISVASHSGSSRPSSPRLWRTGRLRDGPLAGDPHSRSRPPRASTPDDCDAGGDGVADYRTCVRRGARRRLAPCLVLSRGGRVPGLTQVVALDLASLPIMGNLSYLGK